MRAMDANDDGRYALEELYAIDESLSSPVSSDLLSPRFITAATRRLCRC